MAGLPTSWCSTSTGAPRPPRVTLSVVPATATVEDCQATGLMSAAPTGDGAIGPPAPGPRAVVRREHASLLQREVRRERAVHAQAGAEDVVDNPVAFLELEDGDVGLTPDLQLADAPLGPDGPRRIRRGHG